jgi:hypothetical protein
MKKKKNFTYPSVMNPRSLMALGFSILIILLLLGSQLNLLEDQTNGEDPYKAAKSSIVDVLREGEGPKTFGEVWFHLKEPLKVNYNLTKKTGDYIYVWDARRDIKAPEKGWLTLETGFYRINVNLDHSYYLLFDKINSRDILVFNDKIQDPLAVLAGSDIGFTDHGGDNPINFATTAVHDVDGIKDYSILLEDRHRGFLLIALEGWDALGYDVVGDVFLGIFSDRPYFIDANRFKNLQKIGVLETSIQYRDPDEISKTWALIPEYDSAVIKGGDLDHLNAEEWEKWYNVASINGEDRKSWHFGSAQFSKMFPTHRIIGQKTDGGIIFSLPDGRNRFDDSLGIYGDQIVGEFLINVDRPEKAVAYSVEPVNEYMYFYDVESYNTSFIPAMTNICEKYGLTCPDAPLKWHEWRTKRFAYVITLVSDWYDPEISQVRDEAWGLANSGLEDFEKYEDAIFREIEQSTL